MEQLANDRDHVYSSLAQGWLRSYSALVLTPMELHEASAADAVPVPSVSPTDPSVPPAYRQKFRRLYEAYYTTLTRRVTREHARLQDQEQRNRDAYIRFGEVFDDRQATFERQSRELRAMVECWQSVAGSLQVVLPELPDSQHGQLAPRLGVNLDARSTLAEISARMEKEYASGKSPWQDEETRQFYTDLCDLRAHVPANRLGSATAGPTEVEEAETGEESATAAAPADEKESASVQSVLDRLPTLASRTMVDEAAIELAFQSKMNVRKKLAQRLLAAPKQRWDLLPYYARLIATLQPYVAGLAEQVLDSVRQKFRQVYQNRKVDRQQRGQVCGMVDPLARGIFG